MLLLFMFYSRSRNLFKNINLWEKLCRSDVHNNLQTHKIIRNFSLTLERFLIKKKNLVSNKTIKFHRSSNIF